MIPSAAVLAELERILDPEHVTASLERRRRNLLYHRTDRPPLTLFCPQRRFQPHPYAETYADMDKMLSNQLIDVYASAVVRDDTVPMIRANYGVGTLPSLFGCTIRLVGEGLPWCEPLGSEDAVRNRIERGMPDLTSGLGGRLMDTIGYYLEALERWPVCRRLIRIYHPDLQGPFDVAHLIWGTGIYYAMVDDPDQVHALLRLVTDTYIALMRRLKTLVRDDADGIVPHWGSLYRGGVVLRNDTAVNLSREMYEEFVQPYDRLVLDAFGGGSMHYCGRADQWVSSMLGTPGLLAMNFGQPPNLVFGFGFLEKVFPEARRRGIPFVNYDLTPAELSCVDRTEYASGISFCTRTEGPEEARDVLSGWSRAWGCPG